jgi:4-aminobutyrate aminotransferase-like enzyme
MICALKGDGLIRGVELVNAQGVYDEVLTNQIQHDLLDAGVLVRHSKYTLIFKPPIVITPEEIDKGFATIKQVFKKYI